MRILQLHSDFIEIKPIKKEIAIAEDAETRPFRLDDLVVLFTCVEQGDDESVAKQAMSAVNESLKTLKANRILIYPYAHLSTNLAKPADALRILKTMEKHSTNLGLETHRSPFGWNKQFTISIKGHPLAEQSKIIVPIKEAKKGRTVKKWKVPKPEYLILKLKGDTADPKDYPFGKGEEDIKTLVDKEVFKKEAPGGEPRIISVLKKFGFEWEPSSDSGHMRYGPKAALMVDLAGDYAWQSVNELKIPSFSIKGTNLFNLNVPAIKEHADLFGERLYTMRVDNEEFILKYASCFQQFTMLKDWMISYRQIPFGMFEIADSYRLEQSGETLLGFRLRRFYMPDYHVFCRDLEQAKEMMLRVHKKIHEKVRELGNHYVSLYNLTKSFFEKNRDFMRELVEADQRPALLHFVPEGKYYWVINVEYHITDELKRSREIATVQIDMGNAKRFGIKYIDEKRGESYPPILHTAVIGGIERYIYTVLDAALKKKVPSLPLWLSPTQIRIIPISDKFTKDAVKIADELETHDIRVDIDDRPLTMQRKVREAEMEWINYVLVVGQREMESGILAVRDRELKTIRKLRIQELTEELRAKTAGKPLRSLTLPRELSKRPQF
ncbi:MAG TPA: threonine--tRNA ligase [Candidatus Bathyarchaeia archaeon]|nr:threonine--tRNA ligase [Candidatus Bathyarchaeia archaeon]